MFGCAKTVDCRAEVSNQRPTGHSVREWGSLQATLETLEDLATAGFHSLPINHQLELNSGCHFETGHELSTCPRHTRVPPAWPLAPLGLQVTEGSREVQMAPQAPLGMIYPVASEHPEPQE